MRKIISKIAGAILGLSLALGVGIGLFVNPKSNVRPASATDATAEFTQSTFGVVSGAYSSTVDSITLSVTASAVTANYAQVYKNQKMTLTGATMTKVEFTTVTSYTGSGFGTAATTGGGTFTTSGTSSVWTGSATELEFTASVKQVRYTKVVVTYDGGDVPVTAYDVIDNVQNGSLNKSSVNEGSTLSALITPDSGYYAPETVSVLMGGESTAFTYTNNTVTVENVTGDVTISGSCVAIPNPVHAGTQGDPYTVADAIHAIDLNSGLSNVYASFF